MYRFLPVILLIVITCPGVNGQFFKENQLYLTEGLRLGNYFGAGTFLTWASNDKYSFQFGYSGGSRKAASTPGDYSGGLGALFSFGLSNPHDDYQSFEIGAGRMIYLTANHKIRLHLIAGLSGAKFTKADDWQHIGNSGDFLGLGTNYAFSYSSEVKVGMSVKPQIEFPLARFFALSIAPFMYVYRDDTIQGAELSMSWGFVRKKLQ